MNSVLAVHKSWCKAFQLLNSVSPSLQLDVITHSSCLTQERLEKDEVVVVVVVVVVDATPRLGKKS